MEKKNKECRRWIKGRKMSYPGVKREGGVYVDPVGALP